MAGHPAQQLQAHRVTQRFEHPGQVARPVLGQRLAHQGRATRFGLRFHERLLRHESILTSIESRHKPATWPDAHLSVAWRTYGALSATAPAVSSNDLPESRLGRFSGTTTKSSPFLHVLLIRRHAARHSASIAWTLAGANARRFDPCCGEAQRP